MGKRAVGWIGALGLLMALAWSAGVLVHSARRVFNFPILAAAREAPEVAADSQDLPPRDPNFLAPQRLDAWQIIGPGGGGTFYHPSISPHDPNLVFVSTDMGSCYVSENGGRTWRAFSLRANCKYAFDPKLPNRVYAMAIALWRSDDRGHTWSMVYPESDSTFGYSDDEAELWIHSPSTERYGGGYYVLGVDALQVDPDDSNTLYAIVEGELQVSRNAGKTWKSLTMDEQGRDQRRQLWVDPTSPRGNRTVYVRHGNTIGTWDGVTYVKRVIDGVTNVAGAAFGVRSGGGKPVLYVAGDYTEKDGQLQGGVMASEDGGTTWRSLNENLLSLAVKGKRPTFSAIAVSAQHAEVLYLGYLGLVPASDPTKEYYGVLKTSDGGLNWSTVRQEADAIAPNMHNDWTSVSFGPDWGEEPVGIGVDSANPGLVYTTDLGRVMRSVDGGRNWYGVFSQSTGRGYTTTGLDVTTCYGVHFDPFDPKRMFIGYTDIGLMRSEDGGESWVSTAGSGVPRAWSNSAYWMEFDPAVKGKVWAVMASLHDLPRYREINHWNTHAGGLVTSVDGGRTWTAMTHGLPPTVTPTHILLDPKSPVTARVLYIAAFGRGVYKSTDGGQTWALKNDGLPKDPLTWRMALGGDGTLYLVTIRRSEDGKFGNDQDGWLFRSRNGADSWERVTLPEGVNGPMGITVDPKDPARLYLSAWARYQRYAMGVVPPDGGVYLSADGGQHWQNVFKGSRRIYDVTVDARNSDIVYATGFEAGAWRSADRGKTWSRIAGFNFWGGHRVIPDPADAGKIYITTMGSSVWHGPAVGDPNAVEDIVWPASMRFRAPRPK
jgi:photosystem II stability/assembly factor-like uncharacterized protein